MKEHFFKAFKEDIVHVQNMSIPQMQKLVADWNDHILEGQILNDAEKLLQQLAANIDKFESLLAELCLHINEQSLGLLTLLTLTLGLIVPTKLLSSEYMPYLIEKYYSNSSQQINFLIALFNEFHFRDVSIHLPQITDPDVILAVKQMKITLFDRKYIILVQNIQKYNHEREQSLFDSIIKQYNELKIYAFHPLHHDITESIKKFIDYESQELAERYVDIELNEYYQSIPSLKDVTVIRAKETLNRRKLFIVNEVIHVPEDETIEYKEMVNFESKNQFIIKKAVCALMNQQGGSLFIGIKDSLEVRGYNIGNNVFLFRNLLWEMCFDKIHPPLQLDKDVFVDIVPLLSYEGNPIEGIEGMAVIKIDLVRGLNNSNVYTFGELLEYHQSCEVTFCFKRYGDESKSVKHYHLKQLIKMSNINNNTQILDHYGIDYKVRNRSRKRYSSQSKNKENLQSQIFYSKEFQPQPLNYNYNERNIYQINEGPNESVISQNSILENKQEKQQVDFWKQCLIFRKMNKLYFEKLMNYLQVLNGKGGIIQDIIPVNNTIHVIFKNTTKEEIIKEITDKASQNLETISFSCGLPHVLQVEFTDLDLYAKISTKLKLHNFSVEKKSECFNVLATHLDDLIVIYKFLKQEKFNVHWKLNEQQDIIIKEGILQKNGLKKL